MSGAADERPKRRPGRPATGETPQRSIRLPADMLAGIEEHRARLARITRGTPPSESAALRDLISRGLVDARKLDALLDQLERGGDS